MEKFTQIDGQTFIIFKLIFLIYISLILYFSFTPQFRSSIPHGDKIKLFGFHTFRFLIQKSCRINNSLTMLYVVLFGTFIEFIQFFVVQKCKYFDVLADVIDRLIVIIN